MRDLRTQQDLFDPRGPEIYIAVAPADPELARLAPLLRPIGDLNLPRGLVRRLAQAGYSRVGDVVTSTEIALRALPLVEASELELIVDVLASLDLTLGMSVAGWPPRLGSAAEPDAELVLRLRRLSQDPLGAQFVETGEAFAIRDPAADADDAAARRPMTRQLHQDGLRKLQAFTERARRLDNQPGWEGVTGLCRRFSELLDRDTTDIPLVIGSVYSATLELGSFLEFDRGLEREPASGQTRLDGDLRRSLEDTVRTLAPWVRRFPSAQELDDESGQFLVKALMIPPAAATLEHANRSQLLNARDLALLRGLFDAAERGEAVGEKARSRAVRSTRNIVFAVVAAAAPLLADGDGGEASDSELLTRLRRFLDAGEADILALVNDLPADIRFAVEALVDADP